MWTIRDTVVWCLDLVVKMDMAGDGRRHRVGSLQNRKTTSILTALIPYDEMDYIGCGRVVPRLLRCLYAVYMTREEASQSTVQNAEDAQAGYTCHFQNKQAARSCDEVKEDMKGARTWQVTLIDKSASRMYFTSSFSYAYGKGIVS